MDDLKIAVLIDAENVSSKYIKTIIDEASKEGVVTYKRIFGDWTSAKMASWKDVLLEHSITPIQQYAYTTGKNSTDSAMIIDAMDILYTGKVDGFCLVSSDSDFTKLAARLKEAGKTVIGMGQEKTPKPFVAACSKFKYLDIITGDKKPGKKSKAEGSEKEESALTEVNVIKQAIKTFIEDNANPEGLVLASGLGTYINKKFTDFDCRNYGERKFIDLLKKLGFNVIISDDNTTYNVGL